MCEICPCQINKQIFYTNLNEIIMSAAVGRSAQIVSQIVVSLTKEEIENTSEACQTSSIYFSMSNYTRRELMFDTPRSDNVKLQVAQFSCVRWQHFSGRRAQCSDGWLSVLSDYFCWLYFPFEPRKIAAKLLTCSESHYVSTSMCLEVLQGYPCMSFCP